MPGYEKKIDSIPHYYIVESDLPIDFGSPGTELPSLPGKNMRLNER